MELLSVATQHAYSAERLLAVQARADISEYDTFAPVTSLMYQAFQLTFKAYALHEHGPIKQYKSLRELVEMYGHLGFSTQELLMLKTLSRQQAFTKGIDNNLWENPQQLQVFCEQILDLYARLQQFMPIELLQEYQ